MSASDEGFVSVCGVNSDGKLAKLYGHKNTVRSVVALRDNARALSGGFDGTLKLWDLASGTCLKTIECGTDDTDHVFGAAVGPAGTWAIGPWRWEVRVWNLETGRCLATLKGHSRGVRSVQIQRRTVCGFGFGRQDRQSLGSGNGNLRRDVGGSSTYVHSVAISPDGTLVASTGFQDGTVRLWDWKSGVCLQVFKKADSLAPTPLLQPRWFATLVGSDRNRFTFIASPASACAVG